MDDSTIARIRALLDKSRDPAASEAEAASAAQAAERLLARHALTMRDVDRPDISEHKTGIRYLEPWARNIAVHAARLYGCEPLVTREYATGVSRKTGRPKRIDYRSVSVYGRAVSAEVAVSMISYLIATVVRLSRDYSSDRRDQLGFQRGCGERVAHRIWELRQEQEQRAERQEGRGDGTSLVVVEQSEARAHLEASMQLNATRRTQSNTRSRAAHAGWEAGAGIGLGGQVGGDSDRRMLN